MGKKVWIEELEILGDLPYKRLLVSRVDSSTIPLWTGPFPVKGVAD